MLSQDRHKDLGGPLSVCGGFMSRKLHWVSYAVLATMLAPATGVMAFSETTDASANDLGKIETVVVTAQKREQSPIEVPFALTAYTGAFMEDVRLQEFDKLSLFVPGFVVQNQSPNDPGFVMRGITSDPNDATQEPRVSVFEDGVSASQSRGSYFELFDIERVEVAKGPQSTLFGRSALIGGVNVITKRADTSKFAASVNAEVGDYNYRMVDGMINIPLSNTLAVRLSGRYKTRDGYTKNLLGGENYNSVDTGAARASVAWRPSDDFSADFIFNFERDTPSGTGFKSGEIVPFNPETGSVLGTTDHNSGAALSSPEGFEHNKKLGLDRNLYSAAALLNYKIGDGYSLASTTAYRRYEAEEIFDPDGSALPLVGMAEDARGDQFSQDIRLNYDNGGRVSWFGGISYFYENNSSRIPIQLNEPLLLALFTGQISYSNPQPTAYYNSSAYLAGYTPVEIQGLAAAYGASINSDTASGLASNLDTAHWEQYTTYGKTKSVDLYGDVTFHLTDVIEWEAGLRYSHDDKQSAYAALTNGRSVFGGILGSFSQSTAVRNALLYYLSQSYEAAIPDSSLPNFGVVTQPTANNGDKIARNYHDNSLTWRTTLRYAVEENSSLYATYSRGRRPDVLAASSPSAPYEDPNFTRLKGETVDSYEVGYKTLALDGHLRTDVAIYYYAYDNFQTTVIQNAQQVTTNAGKADAYGMEASADWAAASWADIFVTYTYSHARFGGDSIYRGNRFRLTPDHKLSVGATLRRKLFDGTFTLLPTYTWQSKIYFDDDNDIASEQTSHYLPDTARNEFQGDYGLAGISLSYQPDAMPWSVRFFVSNLFNHKYIKDAGNTGDAFGIPTFIAGEPRFVGMSVSVRWP